MQMFSVNNFQLDPPAPVFNPAVLDSAEQSEFEARLVGYLVLSSLAKDQRWITVVTDKAIDRQRYKALFGQKSRLRFVMAKTEDILWISWQCLAQGNSQAVVTLVESVAADERQHLMSAAQIGDSTLHLIQTG
jgi:cell division inhibitor SulA